MHFIVNYFSHTHSSYIVVIYFIKLIILLIIIIDMKLLGQLFWSSRMKANLVKYN